MIPRGRRTLPIALLALCAASCTTRLFSNPTPPADRSRPVVKIETRGGVEYGAATTEGLLFLGRTSTSGHCRIHYFLGKTPVIEDGEIVPFGGVYWRADVDTKQQRARLLVRDPEDYDDLLAVLHREQGVELVPVRLARGEGLGGYLLDAPAVPLPAGTGIFARDGETEELYFVGLVTGAGVLRREGTERRLVVFAGTDQLRDALAVPAPWPEPAVVKHRPDDISFLKRRSDSR